MPELPESPDSRVIAEFLNTEMEAGVDSENGMWEVIVKYNGDIAGIEGAINGEVEILNENYAIITLRQDRIAYLYNHPEIEYIELPKRLTPNIVEGSISSCIAPVQDERGLGLRGKGAIVAIIDSGIDYAHPDFINEDETSRILYIWDQSAQGTPPSGFRAGAEYDNAQITAAVASGQPYMLIPEVDYLGHGTAVAGIAAGNGRASGGQNMGVAPEASIIAVKLGERGQESFARSTELMRAIKYVYDKAEALKMPLSVNINYGTNNGPHDGKALFVSYINDMAQNWKSVISVASGNEGAAGHHFSYRLNPQETVEAEFSTSGNMYSMYLTMWKDFADDFVIELTSPSGMSSGPITPDRRYVLLHLDNVSVFIDYGQPTQYNKSQEIFIQFQSKEQTIPVGIWKLSVRGDYIVDGRFDIWLPTLEEVSNGTAFLRPSVYASLTLPSTAENVITVGGYNSRVKTSAAFSGRGYTRNDVYVKPDITAPAVNITSTRPGGGYGTFTGTSIASPFAAGAAALMMEWGIVKGNDPFLYGQRVKAFLRKGATRDSMREYPNEAWGYGTLCLEDTMELLQSFIHNMPVYG